MISTIALSLLAAMSPSSVAVDERGRTDDREMTILIERAAQAHEHLMRGDIDAYLQAIQVAPDFILMDPFGGAPTSAPKSEEHWRRIGRFFRDGREPQFQPLGAFRSDDLIVLVANERAHVGVGSLPSQAWSLRVTLVFRRDEGGWSLVHRHADPLAQGISLEEAGRITLGGAAGGTAE